jgi:hypothetical protein
MMNGAIAPADSTLAGTRHVDSDVERPESNRSQRIPSLLGPVAVCCGLLALVPLPAPVRGWLLAFFVLVGPGMAVVNRLAIPRLAAIAAVPVIGLAAVGGLTTATLWFHRLPSTAIELVLVVVVAVALIHRMPRRRAIGLPVADLQYVKLSVIAGLREFAGNPALILLVGALLGWAASLGELRHSAYSQFGLMFAGTGPVIVLCMLVVVIAFVVALRGGRLRTAAAAIGTAIVIQRLTVTLVTEVPIYGWVYKHLGVVEFLLRYRDLPPVSDIYGQWPSFFSMFAWFADITGVAPMAVAHVTTPLVHVMIAVQVAAIARLIGLDSRVALTAAMIAELVNWVGQDYFSPQATAFVMALGVIALLVASRTNHRAGYLSIPLFAALVPVHQLTPFWVCGVAVALAFAGRVRPRWLPLPFIALLVAYLIPRVPILTPYGIFSGFSPVANAQSNIGFDGTFGKLFTSVVCRSLSAGVVLLAAACAVLWWRKHEPCLVPAVLAFGSFALLAFQSYGGEAIFRVYLFAVPGCAILIAPLVVQLASIPSSRQWTSRNALASAVVGLCLAAVAGLQGYFGLWSLVVEYRSQVQYGDELMAKEQPPVRIISLYPAGLSTRSSADYSRFAQQDNNFDQTLLGAVNGPLNEFSFSGQFDDMTKAAAAFPGNTYISFDRQATTALDYYGISTRAATLKFENEVRDSPAWKLYRGNDVVTIFEFVRALPAAPAQRPSFAPKLPKNPASHPPSRR